jgi:putative ABC transport system substrate-binding protein
LNGSRSELIADLALRHLMPTIYQFREFPAAGGLMSYGTNHRDPYYESGIYVGKILSGPVEPGVVANAADGWG